MKMKSQPTTDAERKLSDDLRDVIVAHHTSGVRVDVVIAVMCQIVGGLAAGLDPSKYDTDSAEALIASNIAAGNMNAIAGVIVGRTIN